MSELSWDTLYRDHADVYELLVSHEDYQGNLLRAIQALQSLDRKVAAEFGAGTGRLTGLLVGHLRHLYAFDLTPTMLRVTQAKLYRHAWKNVSLVLADSRRMPALPGWADFAIEGWAFLQIAVWHPQEWQSQLCKALDEMQRLVRPDGRLILIETLGTGESTPRVAPFFREVYDFLEKERGFASLDIRTDYRFDTKQQIRQVVVPLFGREMLDRLVRTEAGWILPECTGLWWRDVRV
jgi:ubiquinone/menaquinone biosynthesis C-methylase UbiE